MTNHQHIEEPTLADILSAFHGFSQDTQRLHDDNKADRKAMEQRIRERLDDVLGRLSEYQQSVDVRLDRNYAELDALKAETEALRAETEALKREMQMRVQSLEARVGQLEQERAT